MKRTKRHTIRRIALGLAVAAVVPATAQARPMDVTGSDLRAAHAEALVNSQYKLGPGEIPPIVTAKKVEATVEIPYLSHGVGFSAADLGVSQAADDRPFSKATSVGAPSATADDGVGFEVGTGTVSGLVLLLGAAGAAMAIRHSRKAKLSPA